MPTTADNCPQIAGTVLPEFDSVRKEFERNFVSRGERGAACTIYYQGRKVVDLWGGVRSDRSDDHWTADTMSLMFSVTKGMAAAAMAVAHSRGLFDLDAPVALYWPEFAQREKQSITVRQLLTHQAGLVGIDRRLNAATIADRDLMAQITARQKPLWKPGSRHGYHTLTLGWYQSELIRRVDPKRRSLGEYFQAEIADPLGVEFYIGLPDQVDGARISTIQGFHKLALPAHIHELPAKMILAGIWPWSTVSKSIKFLRVSDPAVLSDPAFRAVEIPSAGGLGTARAVAKVYDAMLRVGGALGLTRETISELTAPVAIPASGPYDAVMKIDTSYSMGFSRPSRDFSFGNSSAAFGCPGAGGSFGMADPSEQLSLAYLTNKMGFRLFDDPREKAVRDACYRCVANLRYSRAAA